MGIPGFFRVLSQKYPLITVPCIEIKPEIINGVKIPVDSSEKNPNDVEFDNLYLDMNAIIHPCCHPENKPAPKNEEEMFIAIFECIDRIFKIVRPRRLLYMAIDGVAPRAKMNQQRARRFRASKESVEKAEIISRLREELSKKGVELPQKEEHFDSNCITPGTPFMEKLAKRLHSYIHERLTNDPGWNSITIIISDASVPSEGEHKIMDFIRKQRSNPDHDANTTHCLCGADDLGHMNLEILLNEEVFYKKSLATTTGLATHEPNFFIIREEYKPNQPKPCELCDQFGHEMKECTGAAKEKPVEGLKKELETDVKFIFIKLDILREYLANELVMDSLPFPYDFERLIDDYIFLCTFVGNDFLPHLPSLDIRDGAIDRLVEIYKKTLCNTGNYLTENGHVDFSNLQLIMLDLGADEAGVFQRRHKAHLKQLKSRSFKREKKKRLKLSATPFNVETHQGTSQMRMYGTSANASGNQSSSHERLASILKSDQAEHSGSSPTGVKRKIEDSDKVADSDTESEAEDPVRLWEKDFKDRYYEVKFGVNRNDIIFRQKVAAAYVKGLCWVLKYYSKECPSWSWFYPFHYPPFASDFLNIYQDIKIDFVKGKPFKPLEQLMAVFPAASKQHLPQSWGELMSDPKSPIIDFYPSDFSIDLNGQKYSWQGVTLLPFIDEKRLLKALKSVYTKLTPEEIKRNSVGYDRLYVKEGQEINNFRVSLYEKGSNWKKITIGGISIMKLEKGDDPEELIEPVAAGGPNLEDEPEPPEDFKTGGPNLEDEDEPEPPEDFKTGGPNVEDEDEPEPPEDFKTGGPNVEDEDEPEPPEDFPCLEA